MFILLRFKLLIHDLHGLSSLSCSFSSFLSIQILPLPTSLTMEEKRNMVQDCLPFDDHLLNLNLLLASLNQQRLTSSFSSFFSQVNKLSTYNV